MKELQGKVAFVTGGASGVGRGMASVFLEAGMRVVIADVRTDRLRKTESILREISSDVLAVETDVTSLESIQRAAEEAEAAFGNVHVLCNNAGVGFGGAFLDASTEQWQRVLDINLWGAIRGVQVFLPRMLAHGEGGHIVNTASITGVYANPRQAVYGTSKFAVVGLSEFLRNDLRRENVSVSVLCPFVVDTPIFYPDVDEDDVEAVAKRKAAWGESLARLAIKPSAVGEQVLRAIKSEEFYIFCDGAESRDMVERRAKDMLAAFDRQFPRQGKEPR